MRHRTASPSSHAPLLTAVPHHHLALALLLGVVLVLLPRLVRGQDYGTFGSNGGGIIYYGNGAVVTNPPPGTVEPTMPVPDGYDDGSGYTSYPPCPLTGTVFPNPPQPCITPDGTILENPALPVYPYVPYGYGYGYGGHGYGGGDHPDHRRPPPRPLPRPVQRPDQGPHGQHDRPASTAPRSSDHDPSRRP